MLVEKNEDSIQEFIALFKKKFTNFSSKAPVLLDFEADVEKVVIKELGKNKTLVYKFDYSIPVKENIKLIKDWLVENTHPVMMQEKKEITEYSTAELDKLICETGIKLEEAMLLKKEKITNTPWRIEKIIVKKDLLFCRNLTTGKQYLFELKMPSTILLKKMRESWTSRYAYNIFHDKSSLIKEIYDAIEIE